MFKYRRRGKVKRHWKNWSWYFYLSLGAIVILILSSSTATARDSTIENYSFLSNLWLLVAGSFVFFMNAGFAMLEAGFCRRKNATNVLAKNIMVFCVATLAFWIFGFAFMFSDGMGYSCPNKDNNIVSFIGQQGLFFEILFTQFIQQEFPPSGFTCLQQDWPDRSFAALFFFQLAFAGISATIVSGAVAERVKFWAFILFSFLLVGFCYPLTGHWVWSHYGWLIQAFKFRDFAGSTVVHTVGGMAGLVGAILLKPRQGRFGYNVNSDIFEGSEKQSFSPDNLGFATLGCIILWLGWFGFNGGSTTEVEYIPHIVITTMIAASAGGIFSVFLSPIIVGKPSLSSIINGILGGLVGITASSAFVDLRSAFVIGAISGVFVLVGELFLEIWKIDDPVGAIPVHLFCGFWGTIAVGIFSNNDSLIYAAAGLHENPLAQTLYQFIGWLIVCATTAIFSLIAWLLIGIFLYYLNELNEWISGNEPIGELQENNRNLSLITIARKGMRVSEADEINGSDGVFYNP